MRPSIRALRFAVIIDTLRRFEVYSATRSPRVAAIWLLIAPRAKATLASEENNLKYWITIGSMFLFATVSNLCASTIDWTTWTSHPNAATVDGTLMVGAMPVSVTYTGEVSFVQLNGNGPNYFQPATTFTAPPTVPNSPPSDIIAIDGTATTHTITFGAAVTDPIMEIVSLGQPGIGTQYAFSLGPGQSVSILNQGPSSAFGGCNTCLSLSGTTLTGHEGDGILQFTGDFTSLSWTGANPEFWNGITFGVTGLASATPEPPTWEFVLLAGLGAAFLAARRRKPAATV